jgi:DNA-binding CsgD family transcriptional regulator
MTVGEKNALLHEDILRKGVEEGLVIEKIANNAGIGVASAVKYLKLLGIDYKRERIRAKHNGVKTLSERDLVVMQMRKDGKTLQEIGDHFGCSRELIRQILSRKFPDVSVMSRKMNLHKCEVCGTDFSRSRSNQTNCCSIRCKVAKRKESVWDRDMALRIMNMRAQGLGWEAVAKELRPQLSGASFRARLQREMMIIFSSAERAYYFPHFGKEHFRTPDGRLTSNLVNATNVTSS